MQVDPYPYPSTEGVFAELSLWTKILEFATPGTICSFSQVRTQAIISAIHLVERVIRAKKSIEQEN